MVITLTNLPAEIEEALHRKAAEEGKTVDRVTLDVLARGLGVLSPRTGDNIPVVDAPLDSNTNGGSKSEPLDASKTTYTKNEFGAILVRPATTDAAGNPLPKKRDLSDLAGQHLIDDDMRKIFEEQRQIDPELWK